MLDLARIEADARERLTANAANRLIEPAAVSQLAALATSQRPSVAQAEGRHTDVVGRPLRQIRSDSQAFARPESGAVACDSQDSQDSQGGMPRLHSQARRADILARLLRWGWPPAVAEAAAERIARRDADDDRRTCAECQHYMPGRCTKHRAAGLGTDIVGRALAALPQRCAAAAPMADRLVR